MPGAAPRIAGYDLTRVIGQGGMGVVWEAVEHKLDRRVAVKVQPRSEDPAGEALWAEALVAARIGDPSIVRVLDAGYTLDETPYFAMELVDGTDLATVLADGPLSARRALAIAMDIARAAGAAHEHGVVHRDLKPRNVMIDTSGRARVLDFGIALSVGRDDDRYKGMLAGSPSYMAPEQVLGAAIGPPADVFSIGIILFEMLTGRRPFTADHPEAVMIAIATEDAAPPSLHVPDVHKDIDAVVKRCLTKEPEARYASGRVLYETLAAIAEGRPLEPETREEARPYEPRRVVSDKPSRDKADKHWKWTWRLAASPSRLWPYVANTDRFNKAVGLSPVTFTDARDPESGRTMKLAEIRALGLHVRWREYPFEWVREREHSVFRWHKSGPLEALWNRVTLEPTDDGGTLLTHEVWVQPRGILGKLASYVEIGQRAASGFDRVYRQLDATLTSAPESDPFEAPHAPTEDERAVAESAVARLSERGFAPDLVSRLVGHVLSAPEELLRSLRPFELAQRWGVDRAEVLDLMIHAAEVGMLQPLWDIICPSCLVAHETHASLSGVTREGTCTTCDLPFERDLRASVELVFAPHPGLRATDRVTYCIGAPALRPHVLAQQLLAPGEERVLGLTLDVGAYRVRGATTSAPVTASAVGFEASLSAVLEDGALSARPTVVRAGDVEVRLRNETGQEQVFRVEVDGDEPDRVPATAALTHTSFLRSFPGELLRRGEHLGVSRLAFVWLAVRGRLALHASRGDAATLEVMERLEGIALDAARAWGGASVPGAIDSMGLAFPSAPRALRAAASILAALSATPLPVRVVLACHEGPCIALTRGATMEYFGETLHRASAMLEDCPDDALVLSEVVASDRATALVAAEVALEQQVITSAASGPFGARRLTVLRRTPK